MALVGHGEAELDGWFLAYATRSDSGVLLVAVEPELRSLVLERAKAAADIGLNGYRLFPFLGMKDVYDVEVLHHPFMLETTQTFSTHHIVRRTGLVLEQMCEFRGDSRAESSKGIGPRESFETVTIRFVYGQPQEFDVLTGTGASNDGRHGLLGSKPTVRYRIPESGGCVRVP